MHTRFLGRERSERGPQSELGTQCGGIVEWKLSFCTEIWGAGLGWSVVLGPELVRILLLPLCGPGPVSEWGGGSWGFCCIPVFEMGCRRPQSASAVPVHPRTAPQD